MAELRYKGLIGQSYNLRNTQFDCQRTINWYPEVDMTGLGKNSEISQFVPTPGLRPVLTGLAGASRGGYVASNGVCYWMFGSSLYIISATSGDSTSFTATRVGEFGSPDNVAWFTDNGTDLFMLVGETPYAVNLTTNVATALTGGAFGLASSQTFFDGYIVYSRRNSNQFYWTDLYSTSADALNFATAEASPDRIVGLINNNLDLWIFGQRTIELWYNYGQGNTVFARRPNTLLEVGCASARTIRKLNNTIFWLAQDERGGYMLMQARGYTPVRVSTYAIEQEWLKLSSSDIEKAFAYTYQEGGHHFYVLNIPGSTSTWVYDMTISDQLNSPTWHERRSYDNNTGEFSRNYGTGHTFYRGFHLTGDYRNGTLYIMDKNYYYDNTSIMVRERTSPSFTNNMDRVRFNNLTLDFFTGNTHINTLDPQVMLQWSDDGGLNWSNEYWASAGKIGEYNIKLQFLRLGIARSRVFRIKCSDPIYWGWSGASLDVTPARH